MIVAIASSPSLAVSQTWESSSVAFQRTTVEISSGVTTRPDDAMLPGRRNVRGRPSRQGQGDDAGDREHACDGNGGHAKVSR